MIKQILNYISSVVNSLDMISTRFRRVCVTTPKVVTRAETLQ